MGRPTFNVASVSRGLVATKWWAQTRIVHMRHPLRLLRELGPRKFLALQLLVGGTLLSAVVHPFFMGLVIHDAATGELFAAGETAEHSLRKALALCVLGVGYFGTMALGFAGLKRRGMLRIGWVLFTIPLYWLFMSAAAWRALWQHVRAPDHGGKTPHGLARSSQPADRRRNYGATGRPVRDFAARSRAGRMPESVDANADRP
jgi:hypothetical protein